MRTFLPAIAFLLSTMVSGVWAASDRPNVLLICVDDLRPELGCFGKSYIRSPNIDQLAARGSIFRRHYVQAPTCGASRFTLLTGQYGPAGNNALFLRSRQLRDGSSAVNPSMPAWFRRHGYTTVSVGKVSHHPGGLGGKDWNDETEIEMPESWDRNLMPVGPWQHPRGAMHGLAHGEIRGDPKKMDLFQSAEGADSIYPDGLIVDESIRQLQLLASDRDRPFFLAVGIIRPHLPFGAPAKYMAPYRDAVLPPIPHPDKPLGKTTWHASGEFMKYNRWKRNPNEDAEFAADVRRHYAACVSYADAQVGRLLDGLDAHGLRSNTIVVLWGDHGWHLGEHAIWGKHALFEESLRSPLIIQYSGLAGSGEATDAVVETLDVFPTLCDVAGLPIPDFATGRSLRPLLGGKSHGGQVAVSYTSRASTIRTDRYRLVVHQRGEVELYDHDSHEKETRNIAADRPELVRALREQLSRRRSSGNVARSQRSK